jgi:O-antigen ligase
VLAPALALLLLGALAAALIATNVQVRGLVVIFGGLAVLQSSQGFGATKLAYFLGIGVALAAALRRLRGLETAHASSLTRPLLHASVVLVCLLWISVVVARVHGTPTVSWLRDSAPYVLIACAPVFALDLSASLTRHRLLWILVLGGVISGTSFTFEFLARHQLAAPAITRFALPSLMFPGAVFAYAISAGLQRPQHWRRWMLLAAGVLALVLSSGTRSALAFFAAPVVILFASRLSFVNRALRLAVFGALVVIAGLLLLHYVTRLGVSTTKLTQRFASLPAVLSHPLSDQSYVERAFQRSLAWDAYHSSPLLGVGPGHRFAYTDLSGNTAFVFSLDTPISFLAKFGLFGLAALAAWIGFVFAYLRRIRAPLGAVGPARTALIGYFGIVAAYALLVSPLEDKGFGFGLLLLLALSLREQLDAGSRNASTR